MILFGEPITVSKLELCNASVAVRKFDIHLKLYFAGGNIKMYLDIAVATFTEFKRLYNCIGEELRTCLELF